MIKTFEELIDLAQERGPKRMAVAMAGDREVLLAVKRAVDLGIVDPILVGDQAIIESLAEEIGLSLSEIELLDEAEDIGAARLATELVSSGRAQILMKGLVGTPVIMKQVLDKEIGLRTGGVISHVAVFDIETYHKIFFVTDAAMNIAPSLEQKKAIVENAVGLARALDIDHPKVAAIAANEKVAENMPATLEAKELEDMNRRGEIGACILEGPFALDNAISKEAAQHKGIDGPVAGDADILLMPDIEAGNILYKSLSFLGEAKSAGIIVGTKAPIVLTSRADNEEAKLHSIALGVLLASK